MTIQTIFSVVLFIAFIMYMQIGIKLLPHRKKVPTNASVVAICLAMSIWSIAFSIANSAQDYGIAVLWRRISALGWGFIFALFLHFVLIILGNPGYAKNKWFIGLLYLPAVASVIAFALHPKIAPGQYNLIQKSTGWFNQSVNNYIDWLFNAYYISYTVMALLLMVIIGRRVSGVTQKIVRLMVMTVLATLIISTITDILLSTYFPGNVPQLGPIILLLPIISIYYAIKNQGLLEVEDNGTEAIEGFILDENSHRELYTGMAKVYLYMSYSTFVGYYFIREEPLSRVLLISGSFLIIGLMVQLVNMLHISAYGKDMIIAGMTSISILVFQLFFLETAGMTVWVTPVVLIMISILINNRYVLMMNSLLAVISVMVLGLKVPVARVLINRSDHFIRVFLIILFVLLANYIHQVFIKRLKDNEDQVRWQKLISHISEDFANVNKKNFDEKFQEALRLYAEEFTIDRSYVYLFSEDHTRARCAYEYCMDGCEAYRAGNATFNLEDYPWWLNQISKGEIINTPDISTLPPLGIEEKNKTFQHDVKSLLAIPIIQDGQAIGVIGFDSILEKRLWKEATVDIAGIIARQYADAIIKIKYNEEIEYLAYYDTLTGLPNRTLFNDRLNKEIELCKRTARIFGILFVDLDSFKSINDTLGHESGDELLQNVASKLSKCLRSHDTVSRFGGDEFLIMVTNLSDPQALTHIADKIVKTFEQPTIIGGHEFFITASIGISVYPNDGENSVTLIKNADMAMYVSKDTGKNCYNFSSSLLKDDVLKKMKLTNSLYRAMERNELELYYQPQINITSQKIVGLEALLRWHHPELGLVPPLDFIHLAEQTGLIIPIGEWIIETACQQNVQWQKKGFNPLRMAVNLSIEQFRNDRLVDSVQHILEDTSMDPKYLEFEITESIAIKGTTHIIAMLTKLKALGLTISIDDFGTEYSSLSRIKVMPIDRIKMDMNFVQSISHSAKDDAIVRIIIQLAKSLDLNVIAEGVETEPQLDFLTHQACDEVQGYFYYKPMTASEIEKILLEEYDENSENG